MALEPRDRPQGAHLGHAPGVSDRDPKLLLEGLNEAPRRGGSTYNDRLEAREVIALRLQQFVHADPDRGHARCDRHPLLLDELGDIPRVQVRPREDLLGTDERGCIGHPPSVHVEHGDHWHRDIALLQVQSVGQTLHQCVQHQSTVGVKRTFRVPRRPRRVAHDSRVVLFKLGKLKAFTCPLDQLLVVVNGGEGRLRRASSVGHDDVPLYAL